MDLQLNADSSFLYCLDSTNFLGNAGGDPNQPKLVEPGMGLYYIDVSKINLDASKAKRMRPVVQESAPKSQPRLSGDPFDTGLDPPSSDFLSRYQPKGGQPKPSAPLGGKSVLAASGMSLIGQPKS